MNPQLSATVCQGIRNLALDHAVGESATIRNRCCMNPQLSKPVQIIDKTNRATGEFYVKRIEVKGRLRGQAIRLTTNEWYKAQLLSETYWLCIVWNPLGDSPELIRIHNPVAKLDHAKREIVAARFNEIPAEAISFVDE